MGDRVGQEETGLRGSIERFARLRSAQRVLPATSETMRAAEEREARANALRRRLGDLAREQSPHPSHPVPREMGENEPRIRVGDLDAELDAMEAELLARVDHLDFTALRATLPRAVEAHHHEVVALLEVLLGDRVGLLGRLQMLEYLITLLSTEEVDGIRRIVRDPVSLTPRLRSFIAGGLDRDPGSVAVSDGLTEEVAVELYQAASLDADSADPPSHFRRIRARKESLGPALLTETVIRAVVTYNTRMFNWVESIAASSRESDAWIERLLEGSPGEEETSGDRGWMETGADLEADPDANGPHGAAIADPPVSVFDAMAITIVLEGLRRRFKGVPIGSCDSERIALALDRTQLGNLEQAAILAESPSRLENVVARAAVVGLILRDHGTLQPELVDVGIPHPELIDAWRLELDEALATLVREQLAEGSHYDLASALSGIKAKHLLFPRSRKRAEHDPPEATATLLAGGAAVSTVLPETLVHEGIRGAAPVPRRCVSSPSRPTRLAALVHSLCSDGIWASGRGSIGRGATIALALALAVLASDWLRAKPTNVEVLTAAELADTSPLLASAYRGEHDRGGILIGRIDPGFTELENEERLVAARRMVTRLRDSGIDEAMLYDERGALRFHYAGGDLRRPRP